MKIAEACCGGGRGAIFNLILWEIIFHRYIKGIMFWRTGFQINYFSIYQNCSTALLFNHLQECFLGLNDPNDHKHYALIR